MLTLQLRLTVTYDPQGVSAHWLKGQLTYLAQHAANEGMFTGSSVACAEAWDSEVVEIEGETL